jgi:hypothetical protein
MPLFGGMLTISQWTISILPRGACSLIRARSFLCCDQSGLEYPPWHRVCIYRSV